MSRVFKATDLGKTTPRHRMPPLRSRCLPVRSMRTRIVCLVFERKFKSSGVSRIRISCVFSIAIETVRSCSSPWNTSPVRRYTPNFAAARQAGKVAPGLGGDEAKYMILAVADALDYATATASFTAT